MALDCANGAAWNIAKSVFDALGAQTYVINADPDGFNINTGCGSTHIEGLQKFVLEHHCDVGFAYDGDTDRCLCVDETGEVVNGDHIMYIYGKHMHDKGQLMNNTVVTTVMLTAASAWMKRARLSTAIISCTSMASICTKRAS